MTGNPMTGGLTLVLMLALGSGAARAAGDAAHGKEIYDTRCSACHSLDANRVGPMHRGVYGRKAGSVPDYNYSAGVKASTVIWTEETLDKWLTGPRAFIAGAKMTFHLSQQTDRDDVIAYLKQESGK
jgi:cytochrome c